MADNREHLSNPEPQLPNKAPWSTPEDALSYRKSLTDADNQPYDSRYAERLAVFDIILGKLPQYDTTFAVELYSLLATDESEALRQQVAQQTHCLYMHDKEAGEILFTRLVNDLESSKVRSGAYASIEKATFEGSIPIDEYRALREEYYDASDRVAIREGDLKLRLITAEDLPWKAQQEPWQVSVETAVSYITDLEAKQRNAREAIAHEDFYSNLHHLPRTDLPLAIELFAALATHENRAIRARIPVLCAYFLYRYDQQAAIDLANMMQQDQDHAIAMSVRPAFADLAIMTDCDTNDILDLLDMPDPHKSQVRTTLTLVQGGKLD